MAGTAGSALPCGPIRRYFCATLNVLGSPPAMRFPPFAAVMAWRLPWIVNFGGEYGSLSLPPPVRVGAAIGEASVPAREGYQKKNASLHNSRPTSSRDPASAHRISGKYPSL